jgi:L-ascorbate metabolism protein UlaG (beta-lactamase superfamily)
MELICNLYKPTIILLPIGNVDGMGPREAAYACKHLLTSAKTIIPIHFNYENGPTDMFEKFVKQW